MLAMGQLPDVGEKRAAAAGRCDLRAVRCRRTFTVSYKCWKRKGLGGNCEVGELPVGGEEHGSIAGDLNEDKLV